MPLAPGTYSLKPPDASLRIRTGRQGAAAKAGHDLLIEVTRWNASLRVADDPAATQVSLSADGRSLRVLEGTGGMKSLDDDDKDNIRQTIDQEVLKGTAIEFRSTSAQAAGDGLEVHGELELFKRTRPVAFTLTADGEDTVRAGTRIRQSDWGMKPYSALFGTLKVADELAIEFSGRLTPA